MPEGVVSFVCTGKDDHPRRLLRRFHVQQRTPGSGLGNVVETTLVKVGSAGDDLGRERGFATVQLRCPTCRRNVRLRVTDVEEAATRAVGAGVYVIDVSRMS